jgi:ABC transport system ATP-binding/permease protein
VAETVSPGSDWVEVNGARKHVLSYLGDFLFSPQRAASTVRQLSGGERNRLLLARLFARPANVLVLDEPTNDLDMESLELLEAALQDYPGTLLLVSHDRAFLDNIVTQTLVAEGDGTWREYVGGYSDWLAQRPAQVRAPEKSSAAPEPRPDRPRAKLSYKESRELEALPAALEALEAEQRVLAAKMSAPDYYTHGAQAMREDQARSEEIETLMTTKLERWHELASRTTAAHRGQ